MENNLESSPPLSSSIEAQTPVSATVEPKKDSLLSKLVGLFKRSDKSAESTIPVDAPQLENSAAPIDSGTPISNTGPLIASAEKTVVQEPSQHEAAKELADLTASMRANIGNPMPAVPPAQATEASNPPQAPVSDPEKAA